MAMACHSANFPLFSSLPAELRLLVFEQALLPLIEPRIVAVYKDMNDRDADSHLLGGFFSFLVTNRSFLRVNDSFIASAATIRQVCTESRDVVRSFCSRLGLPGPQPALESRRFNELSLGAPLRPQGPHADIFLWHAFTLLEEQESPYSGPANSDVGHAKRWLVPMRLLMTDLHSMRIFPFAIRQPLLQSQHDIIALVSNPGDPASLKHSNLVIVSADASQHLAIPGLDNKDRDFILKMFSELKKSFERYETGRMQQRRDSRETRPTKLGPNLYFAYVNPLKRSEPPQLTQ